MKILKKLDFFKLPVNTFYTSRDKKLNEKSFHVFHGSKAGGCLTIFFVLMLIQISTLKVIKMFSGELDVTRREIYTNSMLTPKTSKANIYDSNFMASLQI